MISIGIIGRNHGLKHLKNIVEYFSDIAVVTALTYKNTKETPNLNKNIKLYNNYKKMIDNENLDALIIATPHNLNKKIIEYSSKKIKYFLIEKPVSNNYSELVEIQKILKEYNCTALIGHHRRFSTKIRELKEIIQNNNVIGKVVSFNLTWCIKKHDSYYNISNHNWRISKNNGGGLLLINGIHEIDTLRFLFGEISSVKAFSGNTSRMLDVEENVTAILKFYNGAIGCLLLGDNIPSPFSYEKCMGENKEFPKNDTDFLKIFGEKGVILFPSLKYYKYDGKGDWHSNFFEVCISSNIRDEDPLKLEIDHFLKVIKDNISPAVSIDDAIYNINVIDKIKESIKNEITNL